MLYTMYRSIYEWAAEVGLLRWNCCYLRASHAAGEARIVLASSVRVSVCLSVRQWSFRGGTRKNAVPIVKILLERMGTAFPLLSYRENAYILLKMHFAVQKDVFLTLKYGKTRWWPGLRPDPAGGAYDAPQTP